MRSDKRLLRDEDVMALLDVGWNGLLDLICDFGLPAGESELFHKGEPSKPYYQHCYCDITEEEDEVTYWCEKDDGSMFQVWNPSFGLVWPSREVYEWMEFDADMMDFIPDTATALLENHRKKKTVISTSEPPIGPRPRFERRLFEKSTYSLKLDLIVKQGGRCGRSKEIGGCWMQLPADPSQIHLDHIIPVSKGGTNDPSNFQVLCSRCNLRKGAKLLIPSHSPRQIRLLPGDNDPGDET